MDEYHYSSRSAKWKERKGPEKESLATLSGKNKTHTNKTQRRPTRHWARAVQVVRSRCFIFPWQWFSPVVFLFSSPSLNKRKRWNEDRPKEKRKRNYFAFYFSQPQLVCLFFPFSLFSPHSFSIILFHGSFFLVFCSLSFLEIVKWNPISSLWV